MSFISHPTPQSRSTTLFVSLVAQLVVHDDGTKVKLFYGMSSSTAMEKHAGGVANYRSSEGKTVSIPYKGTVHNTILDVLGGIRSSCTYVGASSLKELPKRTTFIRCKEVNWGNPYPTRKADRGRQLSINKTETITRRET